jgi:hypothetical protein
MRGVGRAGVDFEGTAFGYGVLALGSGGYITSVADARGLDEERFQRSTDGGLAAASLLQQLSLADTRA